MKKWAISAIVYLLVVVGAYTAYSTFTGSKELNHSNSDLEHQASTEHVNSGEEHGHGDEHSDHNENSSEDSQVLTLLHEENGELIITLKDEQGNPVTNLEVNHEKLMHLIVVSSDLEQYYHLHPEADEPGVFKVAHTLSDGEYKVFVDIKPKDLNYKVQPISFILGSPGEVHEHHRLQKDEVMVKEINTHKVTLEPSTLKANEDVQLKFDLNGETPEQHLGALGHVVILDETANQYIHVHPLDGNEPIFETKFTKPGTYKIWAEFKFNSDVFVFPYVVEIN